MSALPDRRIPYEGRLTFDEASHTYQLDGLFIPGITSVLKAAGVVDDRFYTTEARDRGLAVHAAIEYLIEGDLAWERVHPVLEPYLCAYERFVEEMGWEPVEAPELLVGSETLRFATRIDGIGRTRGNPRLVVGNWKTGQAEKWHAIQSAGEAVAYAETVGRTTTAALRRAAIYLRDDGTYRFHEHPDSEMRRDVEDFRAAVRVFHLQERLGLRARKEN